MFTSDVTQTYNRLDASAEILIMLLGAFLLGFFLSWLLRQNSVNKSTVKATGHSDTKHKTQADYNKKAQANIAKNTIQKSGKSENRKSINKVTSNEQASLYKNSSDFKIINGITPEIESLLRDRNINSYSDLRDIDNKTLNEILSSVTDESTKQSVKTWSHQAALAAKGDWRKLSEYQDFIEQAMLSEKDTSVASSKNDDLQKIKGIGPQITKILNSKGIHTFKQLKQTDAETLKEYISNADKRFKNNQTSTWPHQASMAEKKQWKELAIYQEFMDDINIDSENLAATTNKANPISDSLNLVGKNIDTPTGSIKNDSSFVSDDFKTKISVNSKSFSSDRTSLGSNSLINHTFTNKTNHTSNTQVSNDNTPLKDDLKIIEGIDSKIEDILNNAQIYTLTDLKQSNRDFLKSLLNKAGAQYQMHEPVTWPLQAEIACNKEWDKLKEYQNFLSERLG